MKFLYICDQDPFQHFYGSQQRSSLLLRALSEIGHVDLVCFTKDLPGKRVTPDTISVRYFGDLPIKDRKRWGKRILKLINLFISFSPYSVFPKNRTACSIVQKQIQSNDYNFIVIRYIRNALLCGLMQDKRIVVDVDDLPEQNISTYITNNKLNGTKKIRYKIYYFRARIHTGRFIKGIKHAYFSNKDQSRWRNSSYLPNIPFPVIAGSTKLNAGDVKPDPYAVLFVGYMLHTPNYQGIQYFLDNVWGMVKKSVPEANLKIAGSGLTNAQKSAWDGYEGVEVLGFVEDLQSEYFRCRLAVVPIYFGAGTNIKVLEAMSLKKAVVASEFASNPFGDHLSDGFNIMIAKNSKEFASKVIQLLIDESLNAGISENGYNTICEKYTYSTFRIAVLKPLR